jgi:effector-binding domain-containing protein
LTPRLVPWIIVAHPSSLPALVISTIREASMEYEISVERVEPRTIASVRRRATQQQLSTVVPAACGDVWNFVRANGIAQPGRLVALYRDGGDGQLDVEVGVEVGGPFTGTGEFSCSAIPGGVVATTVHLGPYNRLGEAHKAICQWCKQNHHKMAGLNYEIYGHWDDDPAKLRTDVFYQLED